LTDFDKVDHRSSGKEDYFIVSDSAVDDLDYPSYVSGKGSDEYSAVHTLDNIIKRFSDDLF
jgi:cephalosporin hydroxylase